MVGRRVSNNVKNEAADGTDVEHGRHRHPDVLVLGQGQEGGKEGNEGPSEESQEEEEG